MFELSSKLSRGVSHTLLGVADGVASTVTSSLFNLATYGPVNTVARTAVLAQLSRTISYGRLTIVTDQGSYTLPAGADKLKSPPASAEIRVKRESFWLRLMLNGDVGFSEAYMSGDCDVSDLVELFKIFIRSRPTLASDSISAVSTVPSKVFGAIGYLANFRLANATGTAQSNIHAHYDLSNEMFERFLSRDMMYSSAIFPELDTDLLRLPAVDETLNNDELEQAQIAKILHIVKKADIRAGHRVMDIGCGWGSFAIEAVKATGCTVDGLTLSIEQKKLAEDRIAAAGLSDSITIHLMDYRHVPDSWKGAFDRVVSIEMLEHVGKEYTETYFSVINSVLNPKTGAACIQVITIPETRFEKYNHEVDFIKKYIFPGGWLPSVTYTIDCVTAGSKGLLVVDSVTNIGPHYGRTLRQWRRNFLAKFEEGILPALKSEYPEMNADDIESFKRRWVYYFAYCEAGFSERVTGDHIFTITREGDLSFKFDTFE